MNSENYKKEIKFSLDEIIDKTQYLKDNMENYYNHTYAEIRKEIFNKKEKFIKNQEEINKLYDMLGEISNDKFKSCEKLVKKILPLRTRFLNSIHCNECGVTENNKILVGFYFNDDYTHKYFYYFPAYQIRNILHIK